MNKVKTLCLLLILTSNLPAQPKPDTMVSLNGKEQSIVLISANAANGNLHSLKTALSDGLNAGLTVNEVKEILVQLYAYAGFPRSLNALHTFMEVLDDRKSNGITDLVGKAASSVSVSKTMLRIGQENQTRLVGSKIGGGVYAFVPAIDQFLKEHLFGAIFSRDILDWKTRELVTISVLAAMEGVAPQLRSHFGVGLYNGLTLDQLSDVTTIIENKINSQRGTIAREVLQSVINKQPYAANQSLTNPIYFIGEKIRNDNFKGTVWLNQLVQADSSNVVQVGNVTFEPGARTKWHFHPAGQILLALDGLGYYQEKGSPKRVLKKGDVVKCPPNVPHWHGAAPNEKFVQIAITDAKNGATVWLDHVSEVEYNGPVN